MSVVDACDFVFDAVFVEEWFGAFVTLDAVNVSGHDDFHEFAGAFPGAVFVDEDGVDFGGVDIAHGTDDHVAFFVDTGRGRCFTKFVDDGFPEPQEVAEVSAEV